MLMVIFGAGASYDSAASLPPERSFPDRPPLADHLFDSRAEFARVASNYPAMLALRDRLNDQRQQESVEAKLETLREEAKTYGHRHSQLAAIKFYLRDVLQWCSSSWLTRSFGASNYCPLLDDIRKRQATRREQEPVCLVTFNYDELLESSLLALGEPFSISSISSYVESESVFKIFKLHGSISWQRLSTRHTHQRPPGSLEIVANAPRLGLTDQIVDQAEAERLRISGAWLLPAIAIPTRSKGEFECPATHLNILKSLLQRVSELLLVGWKGREDHFLEIFRHSVPHLAKLMIVDANQQSAGGVFEYLRASLPDQTRNTAVILSPGGFSQFILNQEFCRNFEN